jgi:hypothetical protein
MGGSHLTREARERTVTRFVRLSCEAGFTHLLCVDDIRGRQLRTYADFRHKAGIKIRTIQNELAHLRCILRSAGNGRVASAPELSNKQLGVSGGGRRGTNAALCAEEYERVLALALRQGRPGMGALVRLERWIGLRGNEAIHARSDTLTRWLRELEDTGRLYIIAGTKGGRTRFVTIHNHGDVKAVLVDALVVARSQGGFLVAGKNGQPPKGLDSARSIYHGWAHRAGIKPHAARYAFAQDQVKAYCSAGYSEREAYLATSLDLGHGDSRGRWVKSVYAPQLALPAP